MPFSDLERKQLLAVRYVGKTTIQHLEDLGIESLAQLATHDAPQLAKMIAIETGIDGWETHPLALRGLEGAVAVARIGFDDSDIVYTDEPMKIGREVDILPPPEVFRRMIDAKKKG